MPVLETETVAELIEYLGVPPERIKMRPLPGTATEEDVIMTRPLCELIDGVLVEKPLNWYKSRLAVLLGHYIEKYLAAIDLGITLGAGGLMRLRRGQVRIPAVAFYSWNQFPDRLLPLEKILSATPDLAVEILSEGNTEKEMLRKRRELFGGGASLMWFVHPEKRSVDVYTSVDQFTTLDENQSLDGGTVLPGFTLSIKTWFERAGKRG